MATFCGEPDLLRTTPEDVFGKPLDLADEFLVQLRATPMEGVFKDTLKIAVDCIKTVTDTQLKRYTTGELSHVTNQLLDATRASTPHNVWAERVLGMYDAHFHRCTQGSSVYIETKVQCATNHTLDWLDSHERDDQEAMIRFAVKMSRVLRQEEKLRKEWLVAEGQRRLIAREEKIDDQRRGVLQKKIAAAMKMNGMEGLSQFEEYEALEDEQKERVREIVEKDASLFERTFWQNFDEGGVTETWIGRIILQKPRKGGLVTYHIRFWLPDLEEEMALEDLFLFGSEKIICDLFLGDLQFY